MILFRLVPTIALAVCAAGSASAASSSMNVCGMLTAKQVAAIGVPTNCKATSLTGPGITSHTGTWGGSGPTAAHLGVSVVTYSNATLFQLGMRTLDKLPGIAKKVAGIGTLAYESGADGSTLAAINFVVGKTIVGINLRTTKPPKSLAQLDAIATTIAKQS